MLSRALLLSLVLAAGVAGCTTAPDESEEGPGGGSGNDGDEVNDVGRTPTSGQLPGSTNGTAGDSVRETPTGSGY